jgi:DNA-binding response OmpR family regulator
VDELLARVRVALRHVARPPQGVEPVVRVGDVELNLEKRRVTEPGVGYRFVTGED